jgi:hypothetical protein
MKKVIMVLVILVLTAQVYAKVPKKWKRPMLELQPKASLYIGSVRFGFGADVIFNPFKNLGFRVGLAELSFGEGYTCFTLNRNSYGQSGSFEVLYYLPMPNMQPYIHGGFGLSANGGTSFALSGGMGLDFVMAKNMAFFAEPGIIIADAGETSDTDFIFRLAAGIKLGLIR